jgi:hypothetical protein
MSRSFEIWPDYSSDRHGTRSEDSQGRRSRSSHQNRGNGRTSPKVRSRMPVRLQRSTVIESTTQADRDQAPRTAHALHDATTAKLVVELATTDLLVGIRLDVQLPPGIVIDVEALLTGASIFLEHKTPQAVLEEESTLHLQRRSNRKEHIRMRIRIWRCRGCGRQLDRSPRDR